MSFPSISFQLTCDLEDEHLMQTGVGNEIKLEGGKGERRENIQNEGKVKEMHELRAVNCHSRLSDRTVTRKQKVFFPQQQNHFKNVSLSLLIYISMYLIITDYEKWQ